MARLPRLSLAGHAHAVLQRGHGARPVFVDDHDRQLYLRSLNESAVEQGVQVIAYALLIDEVRLIATPMKDDALARLVQALGRRYVAAYNRRHGCRGTLWSGRFRSALLEPGAVLLDALRWVDGAAADQPVNLPTKGQTGAGIMHSSARQRTHGQALPGLVDPPEFWGLGNTPFERQAAYADLLATELPSASLDRLQAAVMGGWALGKAAFGAQVAQMAARPSRPRKAGRPRRQAPEGSTAAKEEPVQTVRK